MRPKKACKPFALYLKETQAGLVWYARFWDENAHRYAITRSTGILAEGKKWRCYEAEQAARAMLSSIRFAAEAPDRIDKPFTRYIGITVHIVTAGEKTQKPENTNLLIIIYRERLAREGHFSPGGERPPHAHSSP
jgi:hypothetical protein